MGRYCRDCQQWCQSEEFSLNQWRKGNGLSRCYDCVDATQQPVQCPKCFQSFSSDNALAMHMQTHPVHECTECRRVFSDANALRQHSQVHAPRNVACPVCGEVRFRSATNAIQHLEAGSCTGCRGREQARSQIYQFVSQRASHLLTSQPALEYHGGPYTVPDRPYQCQYCDKGFTHLSSMMQHQASRHQSGAPQLGW